MKPSRHTPKPIMTLLVTASLAATGCSWADQDGSAQQTISYPNTPEGRLQRSTLLDKATVDGQTTPRSLGELVAGPKTKAICQTASGQKVPCQPKLLGHDASGNPIIKFPELTCDFIRPGDPSFEAPSGRTEKFDCLTTDDQGKSHRIKIKYRSSETYTEVAVTRLLWTMGYAADTMQPLSVTCLGCPKDPFPLIVSGAQNTVWPDRKAPMMFTFAAYEERYDAEKINIEDDSGNEILEGFTYPELLANLKDNPNLSESQKDRREALAFLNAFFYNLDSKNANQRLACLKKDGDETCLEAVAIAQDVGFTFGSAPIRANKLNLAGWRELPVWKRPDRCDASQHFRAGSLVELGVSIGLSESGRQEVERQFAKLSTEWLHALFATARFGAAGFHYPQGSASWPEASEQATVRAWVEAFEHRIAEFRKVSQCPVERSSR
jgi:hypothetical protein